jgi:hypothetical protein
VGFRGLKVCTIKGCKYALIFVWVFFSIFTDAQYTSLACAYLHSAVNTWVSRVRASPFFDLLSVQDQIILTTAMAAVTGTLGLCRKHAFYLRILSRLVSGTLRGAGLNPGAMSTPADGPVHRWASALSASSLADLAESDTSADRATGVLGDMAMYNECDTTQGRVDRKVSGDGGGGGASGRATNGVLVCLARVLSVLGVSLKTIGRTTYDAGRITFVPMAPDDEDVFLDDFDDEGDLECGTDVDIVSAVQNRVKVKRVRFGWPDLQIDVLKECIHVSQAIDGVLFVSSTQTLSNIYFFSKKRSS